MFSKIKKGFTLIEVLIVVTILGVVFVIILSAYFKLQNSKTDIFIRSVLTRDTNSLVEKLNVEMSNYTVDYEEYFNRRIVGCDSDGGDDFSWDVGETGHCTKFTVYGNGNDIDSDNTGNHVLYYCSSTGQKENLNEVPNGTQDCEGNTNTGISYIYAEKNDDDLKNGSGCWRSLGANKIQSFGEYQNQFWDLKGNADDTMGCQFDDDDTDLGLGPVAVGNNTGVQELYLISKDGRKRIFIRRKKLAEYDFNRNGSIEDNEKMYTLQILKLRGFDLGSGHDGKGKFAYDGKIDTWACDKSEGFICHGKEIGGGYVGYKLPKDINDGWQDWLVGDITVARFNLTIYPTVSPYYSWHDTSNQVAPYFILNLKTRFFGKNYIGKINIEALSGYNLNIQTVFSVKEY